MVTLGEVTDSSNDSCSSLPTTVVEEETGEDAGVGAAEVFDAKILEYIFPTASNMFSISEDAALLLPLDFAALLGDSDEVEAVLGGVRGWYCPTITLSPL